MIAKRGNLTRRPCVLLSFLCLWGDGVFLQLSADQPAVPRPPTSASQGVAVVAYEPQFS